MMIKRLIFILLAIVLLFGCAASSKKMNRLQLGMTKADVIKAMGSPKSSSASKNIEYLKYRFRTDGLFTADYYIRLREGKVDAFGSVGDFGLGY